MNSVSRLVRGFAPEHYTLSMKLFRVERRIEGVVTINGRQLQPGTDIRLHAKDLSISGVTVDGKEASYTHEANDELVITHSDIVPGDHTIVISYSGGMTDEMYGVYPCYYEVDGEKKEVIATQFESHHARQAFPCIDEPEAKATYDVTLQTEPGNTALSNMPIAAQSTQGDWLVTNFETTPRMSTYLLAWVVGDLQKKTATSKGGVEVSIWSTKAFDPSNLDFGLDVATRCIDFFDDYFGVPYPLPKADHVALPDFSAGAMENWGLITYREIALLVDPQKTTLSTKQQAATVIAHELSHQWFGNLVTMKWWNDLWLNESFANMMEYVATDALEPSWNIWLDQTTMEVVGALRRDSLDGVQAIQTDVNHPDEISTIFDPSIVYAKGGRLLRMLQAYIGDEAMKRGLKLYFEKHKYTNTEADDLWDALGEASGKDIASFMHAWMTQPGYPVVSATKTADTITLSQKQFFIGPHNDIGRSWPIPLHGVSGQIPDTLASQQASFEYTDPTPFRLNLEGTAHFITKYSDDLFADILANIDALSTIDRLNLLNEQILLARSGIQSTATLIPLLTQFKDEVNESVWGVLAMAINEVKRFVESDEEAEAKLKNLVKELSSAQYQRLGWDQQPNEEENDTKLRSIIISLSLYGENTDALQTAKDLYLNSDIESLDPELRTTIMANAVRYELDPEIVDELLANYKSAVNSEYRDDIAAALTSTRNIAVIEQLSRLLQDTKLIKPQDFIHWFVWLLRNRFGRNYMWSWARDNWAWIVETFKGDSHYDMFPRYIAGSLNTSEQFTEYRRFFGPLESEIALRRNIQIGYTELQATVELLEADGPRVREALHNLN